MTLVRLENVESILSSLPIDIKWQSSTWEVQNKACQVNSPTLKRLKALKKIALVTASFPLDNRMSTFIITSQEEFLQYTRKMHQQVI